MSRSKQALLTVVFLSSSNVFAAAGMITTEQLLTQIYNFTILFGLLFFLLRKPVISVIAQKKAEFLKQKDLSQTQLKLAKDTLREISDRISVLEKNFLADLDRAKEAAKDFKKQQLDVAKEAAVKIVEEAKKNLGYEKAKYVELIKSELLNRSTSMAKENLQKNLKTNDQKRLQSESFERFQEVRQ